MVAELATAFGIGLAATLSPCALPLYPGYLAYLAAGGAGRNASRTSRWLGLAVLGGVLTAMLALGALIAALSIAIGRVLAIVTPLADLAVVGLGVALLLGRNPFMRLPALSTGAGPSRPAVAAYVYGLLYGPIALPCSGALVVSAFTLSLTVADYAGKVLFFAFFGLGFGMPLLGLSLLAEGRQRALVRAFARHEHVVSRVAGAVLVAVGIWDLGANLPFALLYLSLPEVPRGTA